MQARCERQAHRLLGTVVEEAIARRCRPMRLRLALAKGWTIAVQSWPRRYSFGDHSIVTYRPGTERFGTVMAIPIFNLVFYLSLEVAFLARPPQISSGSQWRRSVGGLIGSLSRRVSMRDAAACRAAGSARYRGRGKTKPVNGAFPLGFLRVSASHHC